jgi:hypothetical protein
MVGDLQFLVAGGNSPMLLEAIDEPRDAVAFPVGLAIDAHATPGLGRAPGNAGANPPAAQRWADRASRIALVAGDTLRPLAGPATTRSLDRTRLQQGGHVARLVPRSRSQDGADWLAAALGAEVDFRREAAAGTAERLIAAPFLAPAACWWARTVVPSRKGTDQSTAPAASPSACTAASNRSQTPACCQRRKREDPVCQGPYRSGRSRHGTPVARRQRMALTIRRWLWPGRPVEGRWGGNSDANRSHCASVSSCRRLICQRYYPFANTP